MHSRTNGSGRKSGPSVGSQPYTRSVKSIEQALYETVRDGAGPIICRSAVPPESIDSDSAVGYRCAACDTPVQVTSTGRNQMAQRKLVPFCNPCGFKVVSLLKSITDAEPRAKVDLVLNPKATEVMREDAPDILDEILRNPKTEVRYIPKKR